MPRALLAILIFGACSATAKPAPEPLSGHAPDDHVAVVEPAKPTGAHEVLGSLTRTMCYGWCPSYTVTVYRDGVVEYVGDEYVKTKGEAKGRVDAATLAQLEDLFVRSHYLDFKDAYESYDMTDMPSASTSYQPPGGTLKKVSHYHGDSSAPETLSTLEGEFDRIIHIDQWIGTEAEREKLGRGN